MKRNKKFLSAILAAAMAMSMAAPAFAAGPSRSVGIYSVFGISSYAANEKVVGVTSPSHRILLQNLALNSYFLATQRWVAGRCDGLVKLYWNSSIGSDNQQVMSNNAGSIELAGEYAGAKETSVDFHSLGGSTHRIVFDKQDANYKYLVATHSGVIGSQYDETNANQKWRILTGATNIGGGTV